MSSGIDRRGFVRGAAATAGAVASLGAGGRFAAAVSNGAATVYANDWILTMEGDAPQYAEAVAVKDDRIAFVGSRAAALAAVPGAAEVDLVGRTMLPGFIDSWGHFALFAQQTLGVNLAYFSASPPRNKDDVLTRLTATAPFNGSLQGPRFSVAVRSRQHSVS